MNKAQRRAAELRCKLGLCGQVDAEGVANILGYQVVEVAMRVQEEMSIGRFIAVAEYLEPDERRWVIAHSLAHKLMHPGNHLQIHKQTRLGHKIEREAEDFTGALLMDVREAVQARLTETWEVAEHFGVPDRMVRLQLPLLLLE